MGLWVCVIWPCMNERWKQNNGNVVQSVCWVGKLSYLFERHTKSLLSFPYGDAFCIRIIGHFALFAPDQLQNAGKFHLKVHHSSPLGGENQNNLKVTPHSSSTVDWNSINKNVSKCVFTPIKKYTTQQSILQPVVKRTSIHQPTQISKQFTLLNLR